MTDVALHSSRLGGRLRQPGTVLLDGALVDADTGRAGTWLFSEPREILVARAMEDVEPLLRALDDALVRGQYVAGWLAYEAGYALEPDRFQGAPFSSPLAWFGVYGAPSAVEPARLGDALPEAGGVEDLTPGLEADAYRRGIARVREHIREGDVYQINLTWPLRFRTADSLALYAALRRRQPTAYGALVRSGDLDVLSLSPELFFRVQPGPTEAERIVTARPMKGTAPRGATPSDDQRLADRLTADPKNRAENLMIVDLLRNDLGRVATRGSVRVPQLFHAERYPTVTQMTSTVQADLRPDIGLADVMRALFPCGSVTGAPKLRAMEIIREIESGPRGVYCGAVGYAAPREGGGLGRAAFNVPIRTAVVRDGEGRYDVGSGVVWDSDWRSEWDECWLKAEVLTGLAR
ncbi:MAG: aminodeoxychorismate synthase component I [Bacteroidota bacterium]